MLSKSALSAETIASALSHHIPRMAVGGLAGTGLSAIENKTILGESIPKEYRKANLVLGAITGALMGHPNPKVMWPALASWPLKEVGLLTGGAIGQNVQKQEQLTDTNLATAKTNLEAARSPLRNAILAAGTAGGLGLGAYGIHSILRDKRQDAIDRARPEGMVTVKVPGAKGMEPTEVQVPFDTLPENLYKGMMRDTKRTVRKDVMANRAVRQALAKAIAQSQEKQGSASKLDGEHTKNPVPFIPKKEMEIGKKVESEHSSDPKIQATIVKDHEVENAKITGKSDYYSGNKAEALHQDIDKAKAEVKKEAAEIRKHLGKNPAQKAANFLESVGLAIKGAPGMVKEVPGVAISAIEGVGKGVKDLASGVGRAVMPAAARKTKLDAKLMHNMVKEIAEKSGKSEKEVRAMIKAHRQKSAASMNSASDVEAASKSLVAPKNTGYVPLAKLEPQLKTNPNVGKFPSGKQVAPPAELQKNPYFAVPQKNAAMLKEALPALRQLRAPDRAAAFREAMKMFRKMPLESVKAAPAGAPRHKAFMNAAMQAELKDPAQGLKLQEAMSKLYSHLSHPGAQPSASPHAGMFNILHPSLQQARHLAANSVKSRGTVNKFLARAGLGVEDLDALVKIKPEQLGYGA